MLYYGGVAGVAHFITGHGQTQLYRICHLRFFMPKICPTEIDTVAGYTCTNIDIET